MKKNIIAKFFTYFTLAVGGFIMAFPFFWMIIGSLMKFKQINKLNPDWIPRPFMWSNYSEAFNLLTIRPFINSFIFTFGVTAGILILSLLSAYAFAKIRTPGKNFLFVLYIGSLLIPWTVILIPRFILVTRLGWLDTYAGLIIPFFGGISVGSFFFRQFFLAIPNDLADAATIDGCNLSGVFLRIYLPLAKPAISAYGLITFLVAWNEFVWPLVITNKQNMQVLTLAVANIANIMNTGVETGVILALSFLTIVPILILYLFAQRWFIEGIASTGLKY